MWDEWDEDDGELAEWGDDALDAGLSRKLQRSSADEAIQPNHQTVFEILRRMAVRPSEGRQPRVLAAEQGIQIGPRQLGHPDNRRRRFGRADGAYRSRTGQYGISLEVERSRGAADRELRKHLSAMRTALNQRASPNAVRGGNPARQPRIGARDVERSATVVVETDPRDARRIVRIRQQTFNVPQPGRVRQDVRTTYVAPRGGRGITVQQAQRMGLLDVVRPHRAATARRPAPGLRRHPTGGRVRRGGARLFDEELDDELFDTVDLDEDGLDEDGLDEDGLDEDGLDAAEHDEDGLDAMSDVDLDLEEAV